MIDHSQFVQVIHYDNYPDVTNASVVAVHVATKVHIRVGRIEAYKLPVIMARHSESNSSCPDRAGVKHVNSLFRRSAVIGFSIAWVFLSIPILAVVLVIVIIYCVIHRLNMCCFTLIGACPEFLTTTELYWLHASRGAPSSIQCLIQLDSYITVNSVRDLVLKRVLNLDRQYGMETYVRLKKRLVQSWITYAWCQDRNFLIENHVTEIEGKFQSELKFYSHIANMAEKDLDLCRPLWNIEVLHSGWNDKTFLLVRMHPCFADGAALVELLCQSLSDNMVPYIDPGEELTSHPLVSLISGVIFGPILLSYMSLTDQSHARGPIPGAVPSRQYSVASSRPINFQQILESKAVANCAISDFAMCAVAGPLRSIPQFTDERCQGRIYADLLHSFQGCNHACALSCSSRLQWNAQYGKLPVLLPLTTEGLIPRLWEILRSTRTLRQYSAQSISSGVMHTAMMLFPSGWAARWLARTFGGGKCLVSNIAGPPSPVSVNGIGVSSLVLWFPPGQDALISASLLTYKNELRLAVTVDNCLGIQAAVLAEELAKEMDMLVSFLAHRRVLRKSRIKRKEGFEDIDEFDEYPDAEPEAVFDDNVCESSWSQHESIILQDECNLPSTSHHPIIHPAVPVASPGPSPHKLFVKTAQALPKESGGLSGMFPLPDSVTIHVVSEDSIAALQTVGGEKTVDVDVNNVCPSNGRRESHGMTVIASVAVRMVDIHQPSEFSPCVERRPSNSAITDIRTIPQLVNHNT